MSRPAATPSRGLGPGRTRRLLLRGLCGLALYLPLTVRAQAGRAPERPSLRLGVSATGRPLAFFHRGVLRGLVIDLARALAEALDRELQVQEMPESRLVDALRGGRIDLMLSTLPPTDLQALGLAASAPLFRAGQMALIRSVSLPRFGRPVDLITTDARVGYQQGTAGARFAQNGMPNAERVPVADVADGISALRQGEIDVFIHAAPTIWAIAANRREEQLLGIFQPLTDERAAWVIRAEDRLLLTGIDRVLRQWQASGKLARLVNRWIRTRVEVQP